MAFAVNGLSPVTMTVRRPMRRSRSKRSRMPGLRMSSSTTRPAMLVALADQQRRRPLRWRRASTCSVQRRQQLPLLRLDVANDGVGGPLADEPAVRQIDAAHARLGREFDERVRHRARAGSIARPARRRRRHC